MGDLGPGHAVTGARYCGIRVMMKPDQELTCAYFTADTLRLTSHGAALRYYERHAKGTLGRSDAVKCA